MNFRTLVIDDSVAYRLFLKRVIEGIDDCELVGTAGDGEEALAKIETLAPDLITLDIEMPLKNGLEVLEELQKRDSSPKVLVVSSAAEKGSQTTIDALSMGAFDFITKPITHDINTAQQEVSLQINRIIHMLQLDPNPASEITSECVSLREEQGNDKLTTSATKNPGIVHPIDVIAIGISTGGPEALTRVFSSLPAELGVPVLIVQHMPASFTKSLAESINKKSELTVKEAEDGEVLEPDIVYLAPGGKQMKIANKDGLRCVHITDDEPELFCRPSVNYTFESVAEHYGGRTLALIMTGLGADGTRGLKLLKDKGATVYSQTKETCSVWGMPGAAVGAGVVDLEIPLDSIANQIINALQEAN